MTDASVPEELLSLNEFTRRPPDTRVKSANSARALFGNAVEEDRSRSRQRAIVKGCWGGNPPHNETRRRAAGLNWTANINWGGLEAVMDLAKTPYYQLFAGADTYITFGSLFRPYDPDFDKWNTKIAERFSCMLDAWPEFQWHMAQHQFWMLFEGYAPIMFDKAGWKFTALESSAVLVPQGAKSIVDDRLPWIIVRQPYRIHELWEMIANEEAAVESGWNIEAVKETIIRAGDGSTNGELKGKDWEWWQQRLKNHELETSFTECDVIWCGHLMVQEFRKSGKPPTVSHFIITEGDIGNINREQKVSEDKRGFLFSAPNKYDRYTQVVNVIFQNWGDGTWHSVRGKTMKAFKHVEAENRTLNRALDGAFIESGLILKPGGNFDKDRMQLMVVGPVTYLPPNTELQQTKLAGFLEPALTLHRVIKNDMASKAGVNNARSLVRDDGRGEVPTARQVDAVESQDASLSEGEITIYYVGLDNLYRECYLRALESEDELAVRFREECYAAGVPDEALRQVGYVRANRMSGYGSKRQRMQAARDMLQIVNMLPTEGQANLVDDYIMVAAGPDKIDRYNPKQHIPTADDALAEIENTMLRAGNPPVIFSGQNPVVHLQIHLADLAEYLAPLQEAVENEEVDPASLDEAIAYTELAVQHCEEHLAPLRADQARKGLAKTFEAQLDNIVAFHGKLRAAVIKAESQAREAALEQQNALALGAMDQAKMASVQNDIALKQMKTASDIRLKNIKAVNSERLKNWQARQNARLNTLKTVSEIQNQRARAAA